MFEYQREAWELVSTFEIMKFLQAKGFTGMNMLMTYEDGRPYHCINEQKYVRMEYENYVKHPMDTQEGIMAAAQLLAEFHINARGFEKPQGIKIRTDWGKLVEKYKLMLVKTRRFYRMHQGERRLGNQFEHIATAKMNSILECAESSEKFFRSTQYLELLEDSMRKRELGIVDFNDFTFINIDGTVKLSAIFDAAYNMPLEDVAKLIRRCSIRNRAGIAREWILTAYEKVKKLQHTELEMVDALMNFPYDSIKYLLKYQENESREIQLRDKFEKSCIMELENRPWRSVNNGN